MNVVGSLAGDQGGHGVSRHLLVLAPLPPGCSRKPSEDLHNLTASGCGPGSERGEREEGSWLRALTVRAPRQRDTAPRSDARPRLGQLRRTLRHCSNAPRSVLPEASSKERADALWVLLRPGLGRSDGPEYHGSNPAVNCTLLRRSCIFFQPNRSCARKKKTRNDKYRVCF